MAKAFTSLAAFAAHLTAQQAIVKRAQRRALDKASKIVLDEAKAIPGHYQPGWPKLSPKTIARKKNGDTPLLETGEMRDSYQRSVGDDEARVGSNNDKALWHELGTSKVPPRPVLVTAVVKRSAEIKQVLGSSVHAALTKG